MSRRHEMIEMLVDNDIDTIMADASQNDMSLLASTLHCIAASKGMRIIPMKNW